MNEIQNKREIVRQDTAITVENLTVEFVLPKGGNTITKVDFQWSRF